jgi:2-octaprenyl-6-methoxyphenol hydroxylase
MAVPHGARMKHAPDFDVLVAGNGPAGLTAALAMADAGFAVALVGPERLSKDARTTALMAPAVALLDRLGVWQALEGQAAPLASMQIIDGTSRLVRARPVVFKASEISEPAFGWNIPNEALLGALEQEAGSRGDIKVFNMPVERYESGQEAVICELGGGKTVSAKFVVAADGRNSLARQSAGISLKFWSYPQTAMVLTFAHTRGHSNISTEFHTETGPFTVVPLPGNRSSLVWVMAPGEVDAVKALTDEELSLRLEERMQSILGKVKVDPSRQFYPLSAQTPSRFAARRIMLAGEAAHVFPPIGAQGLNLGLRDVEECLARQSAITTRRGGATFSCGPALLTS